MVCVVCGRWSPPDGETGYDGDTMCPWCRAELDEEFCDVCGCGLVRDADGYCMQCDYVGDDEDTK